MAVVENPEFGVPLFGISTSLGGLIYWSSEEAYGPKSDGVAPPGSLGGGGRFMRVGPEDLDISFIPGRMNVLGSGRLAA